MIFVSIAHALHSIKMLIIENCSFQVNPATGLIDYDELEKTSKLFRPKLIIAGVSCYSRNLDYERFRKIADGCGAILVKLSHLAKHNITNLRTNVTYTTPT